MAVRKFKKSTIVEVAAAAGVSVTTVSMLIRGRESVCSKETADRIRSVVAELNYSAAPAIRGSRQRSTGVIGVMMGEPPHTGDPDQSFANRLWIGMREAANERNYSLLHYPKSMHKSIDTGSLIDGSIDGLIMSVNPSDPRPVQTARAGLPTVLFYRYRDIPEGCGFASESESDVVRLALGHLWDLGHRRIAHVSGPVDPAVSGETFGHYEIPEVATWRYRHYVEWFTELDPYDPSLVSWCAAWDMTPARADEIVAGWSGMASPPTAAYCANDRLAMRIVDAIRRCGLDVPGDFSIVGIDNDPRAEAYGLTTVPVPVEAVGRAGLRALFDMMDGAPLEDCRVHVPVESLIIRSSTRRL